MLGKTLGSAGNKNIRCQVSEEIHENLYGKKGFIDDIYCNIQSIFDGCESNPPMLSVMRTNDDFLLRIFGIKPNNIPSIYIYKQYGIKNK